jgi:hypothetical protein
MTHFNAANDYDRVAIDANVLIYLEGNDTTKRLRMTIDTDRCKHPDRSLFAAGRPDSVASTCQCQKY